MIPLNRTLAALFFTIFFSIIAACPAQAAIIFVDSSAVGLNDGSSWTNAYTDLNAALTGAVLGDEIWVADGTYYPGVSGDNSATFPIKRGVGIYGGFTGFGGLEETARSQRDFVTNRSILSGDLDSSGTLTAADAYHVVEGIGEDTTAIVDGVTITGGNAIGPGIDNRGGGITVVSGGGTFQNCIVEGNGTSNFGGGVYGNDQFKAINCTFRNNQSSLRGGGVDIFSSTPIKIYNCVFQGNTAATEGGAIFIFSTTAVIAHCTFSDNTAPQGAVIRSGLAGLRLQNSILWNNTGNTFAGVTPTVTNCLIEGGFPAGTNIIDADPLFVDADLRIGACSPAVEAGDSLLQIVTDRDGLPRPFDADNDGTARWDLGAFEAQQIGILPLANPVSGPNPACTLGEDNVYSVTNDNGPTNTYRWTLLGGGSIDGSADSTSVLLDWGSGVGTYFLFVTETVAATGCSTNDTITVVLDSVPVVSISPTGNGTVCDGDSVQLTAAGQGASFQWLLNGTPVAGATGTSFFARDAGFVNVFLTDANGCRDSAATNFELVVNPLPDINFTTSQPLPICQGDTVTISVAPGASQQWFQDGNALAGATNPSLEVFSPGNYNLFQTDANNCSDSAAVALAVVVNALPVVSVAPAATDTICPGDSLALTASAAGAVSFQWTRDGSPVPAATSNPYFADQSGFYNVQLTDGNNCTDSANVGHRLRVGDFEAPDAQCQPATAYLNGSGTVTVAPTLLDGGSTDNCLVDSLSLDRNQFTCADTGTNALTLTVYDGSGNTATCAANLTVEDTIRPTAVCNDTTLYVDANGNLTVAPGDIDGGSSDNCGIASSSVAPANFTCADTGSQVLTLTLVDGSGNVGQCQATVQIADSAAPVALCTDVTVFLDPGGNASITAGDVNGSSNDNCGVDTFFVDQTNFACADVPSVAVTLTVLDVSGNGSTCQAQVRVRDTVPPVVACGDTTIFIDSNGQALLSPTDLDAGSSDNCGIANAFLSQSLFTCLDTGLTVVTVSFADADTNISSCTSNVIIRDTVPPVAICSDTTFFLDSLGVAVVDPAVFGLNSFDNCTFFDSAYVNVGPFTCADTGQYLVTLVVEDVAGQTDSCSGTVTIADSTGPFTLCRDTSLVLDGTGNASLTASDLDLGTFDNCTLDTFFIDQTAFTCADAGFNTVVFTAVDVFGNASNCLATVEIVDSVVPVAACQNLSVFLDAGGMASVMPAVVDNGSADNCGVDSLALSQTNFTCVDTGLVPVTLEVFDQYGNVATCGAVVEVRDTTAPMAICNDSTVYLDANGAAPLDLGLIGGASGDNCGLDSVQFSRGDFTCADTGANSVTLLLIDPSGNTATCGAVVTVLDSTPPVAICPDTTLYLDPLGSLVISPATVAGTSFDNCQIAASSLSATTFGCGDIGVNALIGNFSDASGNAALCSFDLTVLDSLAPTPLCLDDTLFLTGGAASLAVSAVDGGSFDGCGIDTIYLGQNTFACNDVGAVPVALIVGDASGNVDSCTAVITVRDTIRPNAVCASLTVYVDSLGNVPVTPADVDAGSTDDCQVDSLFLLPASFSCANFGTNFTELIVQDRDGNRDTCSATVTVLDSIAPVAVCDSIVVQLNANGGALFTPLDVGGNSSDNCAIDTLFLDIDSLNCSHLGFNTVTLSLADVTGNASLCTGVVEVVDTAGLSNVPVDLGPDTTICNGDTIFLAPSAAYPSYLWSTGATTMAIGTNQPGVYFLDVQSPEGCNGSDTILVDADAVANPNLTSESGELVICQNDSLELQVDPGFSAFLWSTGDTGTTATVFTAGTYTVVVTDVSGCTRASSVQISAVASPAPTPMIVPAGPTIELCRGDLLTLDAGAGYFQYLWSNGATTQTLTTGDPGTFSVEVWNGFGCHTVSAPVTVNTVPAALPTIAVSGDTLVGGAPGATAWQWNLNGAPIFGANDSVYIVPINGNYTVTATYANGCERTSLPVPVLVAREDAFAELRGVSVYPNPSRGAVTLRSERPLRGAVRLRLVDLLGRTVWERRERGLDALELDLGGLGAGLYQLEVGHATGRAWMKVVVE